MRMNRFLISVLLLLMTVSVYGSEADRIRRDLPNLKDSVLLAALSHLYELSQESGDYEEQWRCLNDYLTEARRQGNVKETGDAIMFRTLLFYNNDQNDSIYQYTPDDLLYLGQNKQWEKYYRVWSYMANTYVYAGSLTTGLKEAETMYEDAKKRRNVMGQGLAYSAMGNAYWNMNSMEEATSAYQKAIDLMMKVKPVPMELSSIFSSQCDVLDRLKEYRKMKGLTDQWSKYIYQLMIDWKISADHVGTIQMWAYYYIGCTQAALGEGDFNTAGRMLDEVSKNIISEDDDTYRSLLYYKARYHQLQGQYAEALEYNDKLVGLFDSFEDQAEQLRVRQQRAEIMTGLGKNKEAAELYREMYLEKDSVNQHDAKRQLAEMNTIFHVDELKMKQAAEQARLKMEKARQQQYSIIAIASIIIIALAVFSYFRYRSSKRLKIAHNKLEEAHSQLLTAYDQLEETTTAKERIESDLRIARNIQMGMVPHTFPEREDVDLYASMTPAKEVGGDLYDYLVIGDKLFFCLGDVSGKGVPASLFMAMARNLFHVLAQQELSPAEIATRLNTTLSEDNETSMFVTMFIGVADLTTGHLDFCNAGHNPPVLVGEGTSEFIEMIPNAPIGLWPGLDYEGEEIADISNIPLFVYTDGLNEAENQQKDQFSDERLLDILATVPFESSMQTVEMMRDEVEKHRDGAEPNDDLTMLCVKVIKK